MAGKVDFEALAQPGIRQLRPYDPGHDLVALRRAAAAGLAELGSNENAWGPSSTVLEAIASALPLLHRYPDSLGTGLKHALARALQVGPEMLVLGNGSHELLVMLAQVFAGSGTEVVMSRHGFAVYALAAQGAGATLRQAEPLARTDDMPLGHDLHAIAGCINARTRLVYLANPNNPTGTWFDMQALARLLQDIPPQVIVVVDEAYAEYADDQGPDSALPLLASHANLVVTRTFSKAYALAGLRVGYAVAHAGLVELLERLRESFNVNALGLAAAEAALADTGHLQRVRQATWQARAALAAALSARGHRVFPSQTNFLLVGFGERTTAIAAGLLARGVVPRPMGGYGLGDCLRITVGTPGENRRLLQALDELEACRA